MKLSSRQPFGLIDLIFGDPAPSSLYLLELVWWRQTQFKRRSNLLLIQECSQWIRGKTQPLPLYISYTLQPWLEILFS